MAISEEIARNTNLEVTPDWSREKPRKFWDPGRKLLSAIRAYQRSGHRRDVLSALKRKAAVLRHVFWSTVSGADIPLSCNIGGGLLIPHPNGIVIHPDAEIGPNCLLFQQVTVGTRGVNRGVPRIGAHVDIGVGAKVLGGVYVGSFACIGANAVVLEDVPGRSSVVGIPARPISRE